MSEWAFLLLLTFSAPDTPHIEQKRIQCSDMTCVEDFQRQARQSTPLTRFCVFERGRDGFVTNSTAPAFRPIIDWSPL